MVCLLPGLRRIVTSYRDILGPRDAWAELLVALWEQIDRYDLKRRPRRVAANLLWDAASRLVGAVRRERRWLDHVELNKWCEGRYLSDSPADDHLLEAAVIAGVLGRLDRTLIEATRLHGIRLTDAADLLGISYEAAKKRRQRAETAWAVWWAPELRQVLTAEPSLAITHQAA